MAATGDRQLPGKARKGESGSQQTCLRSKATSTLEERVPLMHIHSLKRAALAACVCGVGDFESSDSAFWLYKVDHVAPEVGGDQFPIDRSHDEVLWYFQNT